MYIHDPTICAIDENFTVLDVKYHEEYDRLVLLKSVALFMEKDKRQILADFWQSVVGFFDFEVTWPTQHVFKK